MPGQFPAVIQLSSLNGKNGFKLDGEGSDGESGWCVSGGDINGDGIADLLIGAQSYNNYDGRGYVVFGSEGIGASGLITLSTLNTKINAVSPYPLRKRTF